MKTILKKILFLIFLHTSVTGYCGEKLIEGLVNIQVSDANFNQALVKHTKSRSENFPAKIYEIRSDEGIYYELRYSIHELESRVRITAADLSELRTIAAKYADPGMNYSVLQNQGAYVRGKAVSLVLSVYGKSPNTKQLVRYTPSKGNLIPEAEGQQRIVANVVYEMTEPKRKRNGRIPLSLDGKVPLVRRQQSIAVLELHSETMQPKYGGVFASVNDSVGEPDRGEKYAVDFGRISDEGEHLPVPVAVVETIQRGDEKLVRIVSIDERKNYKKEDPSSTQTVLIPESLLLKVLDEDSWDKFQKRYVSLRETLSASEIISLEDEGEEVPTQRTGVLSQAGVLFRWLIATCFGQRS